MAAPLSTTSGSHRAGDGSPRPTHFVCRENGDLVPVVAVDELPFNIHICGVPRVYGGLQDTVGMVNLGVIPRPSGTFVVESHSASVARSSHSPQGPSTPPSGPDVPLGGRERQIIPYRGQLQESPSSEALHTQELINAITAASVNGRTGVPEKTYCTHWLFHGECAFTHSAKGCKFKHEMPQDPETMAKCGLKSLPKWWLDRQTFNLRDGDWRAPEKEKPRYGGDPAVPFVLPSAPLASKTARVVYRPARATGQSPQGSPAVLRPLPANSPLHQQAVGPPHIMTSHSSSVHGCAPATGSTHSTVDTRPSFPKNFGGPLGGFSKEVGPIVRTSAGPESEHRYRFQSATSPQPDLAPSRTPTPSSQNNMDGVGGHGTPTRTRQPMQRKGDQRGGSINRKEAHPMTLSPEGGVSVEKDVIGHPDIDGKKEQVNSGPRRISDTRGGAYNNPFQYLVDLDA